MTFDAAKKSEEVRERLTFQMLHFVHLGLRNVFYPYTGNSGMSQWSFYIRLN
jgi:hypothetical protein